MGKKMTGEENKAENYEETCENHAIAKSNHANINITVNIGGKEFTMGEAEGIYKKLKELFEVTVVGNPYIIPGLNNPMKIKTPNSPYWFDSVCTPFITSLWVESEE